MVTAEKRSESLQSVPVSVTALTSAQLAQLKMDSPSDLVTQVPNLQVNGIVGEGSPLFSLRGVSMFDYSLNQSSPVASYIDEVYKGNFMLFGVEMYDLERIEVLRGPQGTLYGKNTTGGAINFITHKHRLRYRSGHQGRRRQLQSPGGRGRLSDRAGARPVGGAFRIHVYQGGRLHSERAAGASGSRGSGPVRHATVLPVQGHR